MRFFTGLTSFLFDNVTFMLSILIRNHFISFVTLIQVKFIMSGQAFPSTFLLNGFKVGFTKPVFVANCR
jgi:hypothetical protein